jgi:hypothetical protein
MLSSLLWGLLVLLVVHVGGSLIHLLLVVAVRGVALQPLVTGRTAV